MRKLEKWAEEYANKQADYGDDCFDAECCRDAFKAGFRRGIAECIEKLDELHERVFQVNSLWAKGVRDAMAELEKLGDDDEE